MGEGRRCPWDELKQSHRWHTDWIWSVAFSENGMLVATGGSDGKLILLRVEEPRRAAGPSPCSGLHPLTWHVTAAAGEPLRGRSGRRCSSPPLLVP